MNEKQQRAFDLWIESATFENDFRPMTLEALVKQLQAEGIKTSSSALGRWKQKFGWDDRLALKVSATVIEDKSAKEIIEKSSLAGSIAKSEDDFEINRSNKMKSYKLIEHQLDLLISKVDAGGRLSDKELRFITENLKITADREDKLLDRIANAMAQSNALGSDEARKLLTGEAAEDIEIEEVEIDG